MVIKRIFGGGAKVEKPPQELDIDDLIVLERYGEAEDRLKTRLKSNPNDLHAHLRLADVLFASGQAAKAVEQFVYVASEYSDDGFHEKGIALLTKAMKMVPSDPQLTAQFRELEDRKSLEHRRMLAIEGFLQGAEDAARGQGSNALIEAQQLWLHLAETQLVKTLAGDQLRRLFAATTPKYLRQRDILLPLGDDTQSLFLVARGGMEAVVETESGLATLRSFAPGDVIGEAALFERKPWPATYRALENTTLLRLEKEKLEQALVGNPDPRGLIDALRGQHHDRDVAALVRDLLGDADD